MTHIGASKLSHSWFKQLSEPVLDNRLLDYSEQISLKFEYKNFRSINLIWKCRLQTTGHFVSASVGHTWLRYFVISHSIVVVVTLSN